MKIVEEFEARGHVNIRITHSMTIEVTKDLFLSTRGDCIAALGSTKGARDLSDDFKKAARNSEAKISFTMEADGERFSVSGRGSPLLTFLHPREMVIRKSSFVSDRTIMVSADKAAVDMPRSMMNRLKNPDARVLVKLEVEVC